MTTIHKFMTDLDLDGSASQRAVAKERSGGGPQAKSTETKSEAKCIIFKVAFVKADIFEKLFDRLCKVCLGIKLNKFLMNKCPVFKMPKRRIRRKAEKGMVLESGLGT